jgi:exosortase
METAVPGHQRQFDLTLGGTLPLVLPFALLAIPTFVSLGDQTWSQESGAQGPIVLSTGAWLLWRQRPVFQRLAEPGHFWLTMTLLIPALVLYIFGRAYDFITLEAAGVYGAGLAILHARLGARLMFRTWFPFLYLAFLIPPPHYLLDSLTAPLKRFVSFAATDGLQNFGIPVAREGVTIFVAQYQLLVEDACSGMNSIIGLIAIGLFYIYLLRGSSLLYSLVLTGFIVPIAIVVNILRVAILVSLTYFYGDGVAQGIFHFAAGVFMFATSVLLIFAVDWLIFSARTYLRTSA